jgi:glyoxylase-like metal-dependent hydrolase (beta-lactamase superfamily II)
MELRQVLGQTWAIEGSGMMGLYRLDQRRCILLDCGQRWEREELADLLDRRGLTPVGVLASHIHVDHSINCGWLRARYRCPVAVPAGEAHLCASALGLKGFLWCFSPGDLERLWGDLLCPVDQTIPAGDGPFSFAGAEFHIVHTPGHSLDHLSIITPDRVCYTGDAVFSGEMLSAKLPFGLCLATMMDSVQKVGQLDCAAYILSHRGVYQDVAPLVEATGELLRRRTGEIAALADRPMTKDELWRATVDHFQLYSSKPTRVAMLQRTLGLYLDYLVDAGRLTIAARRGQLYYEPAAPASNS